MVVMFPMAFEADGGRLGDSRCGDFNNFGLHERSADDADPRGNEAYGPDRRDAENKSQNGDQNSIVVEHPFGLDV